MSGDKNENVFDAIWNTFSQQMANTEFTIYYIIRETRTNPPV